MNLVKQERSLYKPTVNTSLVTRRVTWAVEMGLRLNVWAYFDGFFGTLLGMVKGTHKCLSAEMSSRLNVETEPRIK